MPPNIDLNYYNVYFEVAATIIVTLFLIIYSLKNKLHTQLTRTFHQLLICNFFASTLDIVSAFIIESHGYFRPWVSYLFNTLYFTSSAMLGYLLFKYISVLVHRTKFISRRGKHLAKLPVLIYLIVLISTPWTGLIYSFNESGDYIRGPLYMVVYGVIMLYLAFCYYLIIKYRKVISLLQHVVLWLVLCFFLVGSIILQAFFISNVLLTYFATAIALVFMYMTIMMNDSYIRRDTNLLNDIAFYTVISEKFEYEQDFYICLFKIHEYHKCTKVHGMQVTNEVMRMIQKRMIRVAGSSNVYQINDDFYGIIINDSSSSLILSGRESKINKMFKWMCSTIKVGNLNIDLNPTQIKLSCPSDAANYDSFRSLMDYIMENAENTLNDNIISVSDDLKKKFENERNVSRALNDAIENNSFQIYLQPIYSPLRRKK